MNVRGRGRRGRAQAGWIVPLRDGGQVVVRRNRGAGGWFTPVTVSGGTDEVKEMFGAAAFRIRAFPRQSELRFGCAQHGREIMRKGCGALHYPKALQPSGDRSSRTVSGGTGERKRASLGHQSAPKSKATRSGTSGPSRQREFRFGAAPPADSGCNRQAAREPRKLRQEIALTSTSKRPHASGTAEVVLSSAG